MKFTVPCGFKSTTIMKLKKIQQHYLHFLSTKLAGGYFSLSVLHYKLGQAQL
jgi:hypothetical protein